MDLDLNKGRASRGMENPLSAIFDLAVFFNVLLVIQTLATGNIVPFFILLGLMISGLLAIWLILRTHMFFKYFTHRYIGIKTVRESEQPVKIPGGATVDERFLNYLKTTHPPLVKLMKRTPKALKRNVNLSDKTGGRFQFDIFLSVPQSFSWKMFKMGEPGYGLFIKQFKGKPKMKDILDLKTAVKNISEAQDIVPSRIVLLCKFPKSYSGLSEDLYSFLTREEFKLDLKGKTYYPVIQIVGETAEGYYDFTPLVPEFADRLP
jgi:hypothetical protein